MVVATVHIAFLILSAGVALVPVTMAKARAAIIAWLVWTAAWGGLAALTTMGVIVYTPQILRLATHFGGQIGVGILLFLLVPSVRRSVRAVPLDALVRWQIARIIGGFFLIGAAMGEVSAPFAIIAGTGDVLVGLAAARTWRKMKQGHAPALARRHTIYGLLDFTVAISAAILTGAVIGGPYSLIPLLLVPMAVLAHLAVLDRVSFGTAWKDPRPIAAG
jgi:hypothetical protein